MSTPEVKDFGLRLRNARRKADITQTQLAAYLKVSQGTVGNWEAGRNFPELAQLSQISNRLNISRAHLLGEDPPDLIHSPRHASQFFEFLTESADYIEGQMEVVAAAYEIDISDAFFLVMQAGVKEMMKGGAERVKQLLKDEREKEERTLRAPRTPRAPRAPRKPRPPRRPFED